MPEQRFSTGLSDAQTERLALLAEECAEIGQAVGKTLRHGYGSRNPTVDNGPTNREDLEREIGDLLWAIDLMAHTGDISMLRARSKQGRHERKCRYLHHQDTIPGRQD